MSAHDRRPARPGARAAGRRHPASRRAPVDLGALVERVVAGAPGAVARPHGIEVECRGDLHGDWDADRLAQVASNLIGNALQHGGADEAIVVRLDGRAR